LIWRGRFVSGPEAREKEAYRGVTDSRNDGS
jgi:hypothetical protein